ncbi:MAG TPA: hypothetical protein PKK06_10845 [Phycisphaerae bacterium]|nr:hypothetical protein [Phycisphaerae bacterium]HNU44313.1 hypothetical protein [Phycisphaerae bacterium]
MFKLGSRVAVSLVLVFATGCACHRPAATAGPRLARHDVNVLFNPPCADFVGVEVGRAPWPVTPSASAGVGTVSFTRTLVDWQGRDHGRRDYLRRQFVEVRTGTADLPR